LVCSFVVSAIMSGMWFCCISQKVIWVHSNVFFLMMYSTEFLKSYSYASLVGVHCV
jgi:uncharacterized membrane protein YoaK (UPF0700 family)